MTETAETFYLPLGEGRFAPTRPTESPWDPGAQHGGPLSARLAHLQLWFGLMPRPITGTAGPRRITS